MNALDTNVFAYACDIKSPLKRTQALDLLSNLDHGVLMWQVACEFISASRKTLVAGTEIAEVWNRLSELRGYFPLILPTSGVLDRAAALQKTVGTSYWDSLLYAACQESGVARLYSEDLPAARIAGLEIVNPFSDRLVG